MNQPYQVGDKITRDDQVYTVTNVERLQDLGEGFWPVSKDSKDYQYSPIVYLVSVISEHDEEFEMIVLEE
jgi:hypothetical protein